MVDPAAVKVRLRGLSKTFSVQRQPVQALTGIDLDVLANAWGERMRAAESAPVAVSTSYSRYHAQARSSGRSHPVAVVIGEQAVREWETARGRELIGAEQHAVAKMALFGAFDERPPREIGNAPVVVDAARLFAVLTQLGRD